MSNGFIKSLLGGPAESEDYTILSEQQIIDMIKADRSKYVKGCGYYTIFTYMLWIIKYLNKCRKSGEIEKKEFKPKIKL